MRARSLVPLALLLAACGGPSADVQSPLPAPSASAAPVPSATASASAALAAPAPTQLDADAKQTTPAGATFVAPKGWWVTRASDLLVLEAPERDLVVSLFETKAGSAEAAIPLAWARVRPAFAGKATQTNRPPPREGWDEVVQVSYDVPAAEARAVSALARRKGDTTYVTIVEGSLAAFDRRGAQLQTAVGSFRAKGVEEESFAGKVAQPWIGKRLEALIAFVEEGRRMAGVPGASFALVQNGNLVVARGFGTRALGGKEPASVDTLYLIGSITKSMTSLMMAKLVDEGRFRWDSPVTDVWPAFALGDPEATKKLQMKHTVCACTGLPRQDLTFFFEGWRATPEARVAQMKELRPTTAFGETFQYSNLMVSAGGFVAAHAADGKAKLGPAYDATFRSRVLAPLGMTTSTFDTGAATKRDHAMPHAMGMQGYVPFPEATEGWLDSVRPAGGLWSSAREMSKWVSLELARGKGPDGKVIVSEESLRARYTPMANIKENAAYGLGLVVEKYGGVDVAWHNGGTLGMSSLALWLPGHDTGFVILTNAGNAATYTEAVRRRFFELLFDGQERAKEGLAFRMKLRDEARAKELAKVDKAPGEAWGKGLAGTWSCPDLGRVTVRWEKDRTVLDAGPWKSALGRVKEDDGTERVVLLDPPFTDFELLRKGDTLSLAVGQDKHVFTKVR
jgi:CubicO group peptidase (beta-lactamase class C family)